MCTWHNLLENSMLHADILLSYQQIELTAVQVISVSGLKLTHPYPESFALKSLSICIFEVENSLYMAYKKNSNAL